jgi:hypothetical protein
MAGILITNIDTSKTFIWDNRFAKATYTNSTGSTVTLAIGRVMGRIAGTEKVIPMVSTATDGSEQPISVCADTYEVANGATVVITMCNGGDVAEEKLVLSGAETLATEIGTSNLLIRDAIERNTHIKIVASTELTGYDNA